MASPLLTASIQYIINWAMTVPAFFFIDRLGRRPLLLGGAFGMASFLYISGIVQARFGEPIADDPTSPITWVIRDNPAASHAVVACSYLFVGKHFKSSAAALSHKRNQSPFRLTPVP